MPKNKKGMSSGKGGGSGKGGDKSKGKGDNVSDYVTVVTSLKPTPNLVATEDPYFIWIQNQCNKKSDIPSVRDWYMTQLQNLTTFLQRGATSTKEYLRLLRDKGIGDPAASALTIAVCVWTNDLTGHQVTVLVASSSMNQHAGTSGQVHAENLSTGMVSAALEKVPALLGERLQGFGLTSVDHVVSVIDKSGNTFSPCVSCQKEVPVRVGEASVGVQGKLHFF